MSVTIYRAVRGQYVYSWHQFKSGVKNEMKENGYKSSEYKIEHRQISVTLDFVLWLINENLILERDPTKIS